MLTKNLISISEKLEIVSCKIQLLHELQKELDLTEKNLRFTLNQSQSIIETAREAIVVVDKDGITVVWNSAAEKLFNIKKKDLLGKNLSVIMGEDLFKFHLEMFNKAIKTRKFDYETMKTKINSSGKQLTIEISSNMWTTNGDTYFTGIINDVTEKEEVLNKLNKKCQLISLLFEHTHELITIATKDAKTIYSNPAWKELFGQDEQCVSDPFECIHPEDLEYVKDEWNLVTSGRADILTDISYRFKINDHYERFVTTIKRVDTEKQPVFYIFANRINYGDK